MTYIPEFTVKDNKVLYNGEWIDASYDIEYRKKSRKLAARKIRQYRKMKTKISGDAGKEMMDELIKETLYYAPEKPSKKMYIEKARRMFNISFISRITDPSTYYNDNGQGDMECYERACLRADFEEGMKETAYADFKLFVLAAKMI